jgi:hypothetical protein
VSRPAAALFAEIEAMSPPDKLRLAASMIEAAKDESRERAMHVLGVARRIASNVADELALLEMMARKP